MRSCHRWRTGSRDPDRKDSGSKPARSDRCRRCCPDAADCLQPWSAGLRWTSPQAESPRHASAWPSRKIAARRKRNPPAACRTVPASPPDDGNRVPQTDARQHERGGHDLDEMTARDRIGQLAGARGKFAFHPLAKLGRLGQLIQAAPVLAAGFRFRQVGEWFSSVTGGAVLQAIQPSIRAWLFGRTRVVCSGRFGCQSRSVILSSGRSFDSGWRWHSRQNVMLERLGW